MLVFKHSFTCSNVGSPNTKLRLFNPCNILTKNRESCVGRNISKMIICHTLNDATVCCGQMVNSKYAAGTVSSIFCDHNLKSPIFANILHVMYPWEMRCGASKSSAIECGGVLDTISHCSHNWLWRGYNTWRACMDKERWQIDSTSSVNPGRVQVWRNDQISNFFSYIRASWSWIKVQGQRKR